MFPLLLRLLKRYLYQGYAGMRVSSGVRARGPLKPESTDPEVSG